MHFGTSTGRFCVPGVHAHSVNRLQEKRNHMGQQKSAKKISMQHFLAASLGRVFGAGICSFANSPMQCLGLDSPAGHSTLCNCVLGCHPYAFLFTTLDHHHTASVHELYGTHSDGIISWNMKTATKHYKSLLLLHD
jgi:hypothetical protein